MRVYTYSSPHLDMKLRGMTIPDQAVLRFKQTLLNLEKPLHEYMYDVLTQCMVGYGTVATIRSVKDENIQICNCSSSFARSESVQNFSKVVESLYNLPGKQSYCVESIERQIMSISNNFRVGDWSRLYVLEDTVRALENKRGVRPMATQELKEFIILTNRLIELIELDVLTNSLDNSWLAMFDKNHKDLFVFIH